MKLKTFFEKFNQFAEAPDAVAKMRELVLQLAVQGKLVVQDKRDVPASVLLESVGAERAKLLFERKIKARPAPLIGVDEQPYKLPSSWVWTRLSTVGHELGQKVPNKRFTYIDVGGIDSSKGRISDRVETLEPKNAPSRARKLVARGTVIYSTVRPYLLNIAIVDQDFDPEPIVSTAFGILHPFVGINNRYLFYWLRSAPFTAYVESCMKGTAYPAISDEKFYDGYIALPPLGEQKRIAEKVEELMTLCDRLEAQQKEWEEQGSALSRASLARFAEAPTPANLNTLFHKSYNVSPADLRRSILRLAIQGKLVTENSKEEPILVSFPELAPVRVASKDRIIPRHWISVPLGKLGEWRGGGTPSKSNPDFWKGQIPWVSPKDMKVLHISDARDHISKEAVEGSSVRMIPKGSILMVVRGMILARAFPVAATTREVTINQDMKALLPFDPRAEDYLLLALRALEPQVLSTVERSTHGTCKLEAKPLYALTIPFPPLAEQRRIVTKVDKLMALVKKLEMQLAASRIDAKNLLEALIAEMSGFKRRAGPITSRENGTSMKSKSEELTRPRRSENPIKLSTKKFILRRFAMSSGYRSLGKFDCTFHSEAGAVDEASPICLVGLNGAGKSNLIEAVAEVFCFLELINLPWKRVAVASSRYRENSHLFIVEYVIEDELGERLIRIRKSKKGGAEFFVVSGEGVEVPIPPGRDQLNVLPRRIVGYSSGLNETVSHPFLRTKTIYSEEVREAAPPDEPESLGNEEVFDTRTLYMDYESNAAIIISNYIFRKAADLAVFKDYTRVKGVASFSLRFNRKRAGKSGPNSIVRLTNELKSYLKSFCLCAGKDYDEEDVAYDLDFQLTPKTMMLLKREFRSAEILFMAMHKWSLLNALILSDAQRKVYLSNDITKGALERPPSVPPSDRVFNIVDLKLLLSEPAIQIDYSGLSDGEHQFMQVVGTALLFSEPGTLFLFDEPESHFNPEWRTKFNLILNSLPNAIHQEYIISTHSPFLVSGSRRSNVFKFKRTGARVNCAPVQFETYGASFDMLLKNLFSIDSMIDQSARRDLEGIVRRGDIVEMQDAVDSFAESKEKRRLYEAIIKKEGEE